MGMGWSYLDVALLLLYASGQFFGQQVLRNLRVFDNYWKWQQDQDKYQDRDRNGSRGRTRDRERSQDRSARGRDKKYYDYRSGRDEGRDRRYDREPCRGHDSSDRDKYQDRDRNGSREQMRDRERSRDRSGRGRDEKYYDHRSGKDEGSGRHYDCEPYRGCDRSCSYSPVSYRRRRLPVSLFRCSCLIQKCGALESRQTPLYHLTYECFFGNG